MTKKTFYWGLFALHIFITLYFWWSGSGNLIGQGLENTYLAFGRLFGLIAVSMILLQVMLMGRARWLEGVVGLDKLARIHATNGKLLVVALVLHPLLLIIAYSSFNGYSLIGQLLDFFQNYEDVFTAFIAFLIFLFVIIYSVLMVRRKWNFELWYISHLAVYIGILTSFGHQGNVGTDFLISKVFLWYWYAVYTFVLGSLAWYRFLVPTWNFAAQNFTVEKLNKETSDVTSVYITGNKLDKFKVKAGQFFIVRFLDKKRWWQAHPFSMSKTPDGSSLRLSIKASGDFSSEVQALKSGTKVLVEGPYGIFTGDRIKKDKVLLIAGGIGITPIRSLIGTIASSKKIQLFYANKTVVDITFKDELEDLGRKYAFPIHYVSGSFDPQISTLKPTTSTTLDSGFVSKELLTKYVPDISSYEVFLCGPPPMMTAMIQSLLELGVKKENIYFEKFALT